MATSTNVNIEVTATDDASKTLWKISKSFDGVKSSARKTIIPLKKIWAWIAWIWVATWIAWKSLFDLADDIETTLWKAETVFWEYFKDVEKVASTTAKAMWLTKSAYLKAAAWMQDLLVPMWFAREEATKMTTDTIALSWALAEWSAWQFEASEVASILTKAMLWEREQLKTLWIAISEQDVKNQMAIDSANWLTFATEAQAKAVATQTLIFEKSTDAQEAFTNWSDSLTRKQAELKATIWNVKETIATSLIPAFNNLLTVLLPVIEKISESTDAWFKNNENIKKITESFKALISILWIIKSILGVIIIVIQSVWEIIWSIAFKIYNSVTIIWDVFMWLAGITSTAWESIKSATISVFTFISDFVSWIIDWIVEQFTSAFDTIKWIFDKIIEFKNKIWDSVSGSFDAVWWAISDTASWIWSTFSNIFGWDDEAEDTFSTIWNGNNSSTEATVNNSSVSINLWGVTVQNEADEGRLIDNIKNELTRTLQLEKKGIS